MCDMCSGGSDWRTIHVMRIDQASGKAERLSDTLEHVKFTSMAWTHDNKARTCIASHTHLNKSETWSCPPECVPRNDCLALLICSRNSIDISEVETPVSITGILLQPLQATS